MVIRKSLNLITKLQKGSLFFRNVRKNSRIQKLIENEKDKAKIKEYQQAQNKLRPLDFSITKNVLFLFMTAILLIIVFTTVAKRYRKYPNSAPKGMQSAFEPIIVFIRDDVTKPIFHIITKNFFPCCSPSFFIWFLNMIGMIPFSANVSGDI